MTDAKLPEAGVPQVDSHAYRPRDPAEPWGLCWCGMAQAAHMHAGRPYVSDAPRAEVPVCRTCHGEGRIDLNANWRGPAYVERRIWSSCPDCDTPPKQRWS